VVSEQIVAELASISHSVIVHNVAKRRAWRAVALTGVVLVLWWVLVLVFIPVLVFLFVSD